jgi:hypothetical protein
MLMKVKTAKLAPHLRSLPQQIKLSGCAAALSFDAFVGAIAQNEKPAAANQAGSVYRVEPKRFHTTVSHRIFPLQTMRATDEPVNVRDYTVACFMYDSFSAFLFRRSRPQHSA